MQNNAFGVYVDDMKAFVGSGGVITPNLEHAALGPRTVAEANYRMAVLYRNQCRPGWGRRFGIFEIVDGQPVRRDD